MSITNVDLQVSDIQSNQKVLRDAWVTRIGLINDFIDEICDSTGGAAVKDVANTFSEVQTFSSQAIFSNGLKCNSKVIADVGTPTLAGHAATKAYVDALVLPSTISGDSDSVGETSIGEIQIKWGKITTDANSYEYLFDDDSLADFSNSCFQVIVCGGNSGNTLQTPQVHTISETGFTVKSGGHTSLNPIRWFAIGY